MDVRNRRQLVLQLLEQQGEVSVSKVSLSAGVSEMTIRRDLDALARGGLLKRVHGGAISLVSRSYEPPFAARMERNFELKRKIGEAAAGLVGDGETLILDVGTTVLETARALRCRHNLTVLTASIRAMDLLASGDGIQLISTGGVVRPGEMSLVGDLAERAFDDLRFDSFVMGVGGIDLTEGLTEFNPEDARVKKHALMSARRCIVVADHTKLGKVAFSRIAPLDRVDVLVTDQEAEPEVLDGFRSVDVEVVVV
ncbi:MAG: DeoR/GlpR family DNA-binding transcription regulator [Actinomycetota bacterium]|nr:DeoR/GlpR family DNA-binding transcription regulator [Actinomycetota bacterium]